MNENRNVGLNINMRQILNILSSSLYKGDILSVATRELIQNSFDAVKKQANPVINIEFDRDRTLIVEDNGIGMSPDTVKNVFLTVGGTLKDGLDETERSGGFGIAKVQFFMSAEFIEVISIKDGIKTHFTSSQEHLLEGQGSLITSRTDEPSGTRVKLVFPREYINDKGEKKCLYYHSSSVHDVLRKKLIGYNIPINFNHHRVSPDFSYTHNVVSDYDWGTVQVYYSPVLRGSYAEFDVHCAGLYQFHKDKYFGNNQGIHFAINILPKFAAGQREYPFANSRDDFSGYCKPHIDDILKTISDMTNFIRQEQIRNEYSEFETLTYLEVDGRMHQQEIVGKSNDTTDIAALFAKIHDLGMLKEVLRKAIDEQNERRRKDAELKEDGKDSLLKFINKTDKVFTYDEKEMFSKIASVVYDVIYTSEIRKRFELNVETAGVMIKNGIRGCCLTLNNISGIYLNPIGVFQNANHFANVMVETLIHELGHTGPRCAYHDDSFHKHMELMRDLIWELDLYEQIRGKFVQIYLQYNK